MESRAQEKDNAMDNVPPARMHGDSNRTGSPNRNGSTSLPSTSGSGIVNNTVPNNSAIGSVTGTGNGNVPKNPGDRVVLPSFSNIKTDDESKPTTQHKHTSSSSSASAGFSVASLDNPLPPSTKKPDITMHQLPQQTQPPTLKPIAPQQEVKDNSPQQQANSNATPSAQDVSQVQGQAQDPMAYRPLNVKDALSYLEQVKFQFHSRPDIYNLFLDIMKDFKSQTIDTPGVIERVSALFKGYPNLIQGFNTFLPQGYRIECSNNPNDPIKVTTPMGSSTTVLNTANAVSNIHQESVLLQQQQQQQHQQQQQSQNQHQQQSQGPLQSAYQMQAPDQQTDQSTAQQQATRPQSHSPQEASQPTSNVKKPADVEFSQAITYVNKIKTRFADQPDIYKQFLEILQTYQREQKPIHEVYAQVTILFQNAPDLLDDFKKFLPDSSGSEATPAQEEQPNYGQVGNIGQDGTTYANSGNAVQGSYYQQGSSNQAYVQQPQQEQAQQPGQQNLPPIGSFPPPSNGSGFDQQQQQQHNQLQHPPKNVMSLPSMMNNASGSTEGNLSQPPPSHLIPEVHHVPSTVPLGQQPVLTNEDIPISNLRTNINEQGYSPENIYGQQVGVQQMVDNGYAVNPNDPVVRPEIDLDPSLVPVVPEPTEPIENSLNLMEETNFFERVKKSIGNKQLYNEFLKILNLFSQDLLSVDELVEKVEYYIGSYKELFDWFKVFVGYQDKPKRIENVVHEKHKLDLDLCEAYGPSYKRLPKTDTFMPCSGRDDMCWEVLNDEWVGHPVWASEDSGFIAHRKNQYEETLFKIEEERHEYDYYIESNLRTIQTLETIANKIANMTDVEKAQFKLPPGLGHTSMTIYKKVIRKVYDKERGFEIIDALHNYPAVAVPIILRRLKQKDEEWRRAQREWNKIWRDLEQKVYYKSLDHLGLTFKQADKKLLTTKQLISEISGIKVDQNNKRIHWLTPKPKSQLDYEFPDNEILFDIISLGFDFTNNTSMYSNPDRERIKDVLRVFVSQFFSIPLTEINEALKKRGYSEETSSDTENINGAMEQIAEEGVENGFEHESRKRPLDTDLSLADVLHKTKLQKQRVSRDNEGNKSPSYDSTGVRTDELNNVAIDDEVLIKESKNPWLVGEMIEQANKKGSIENREIYNMFANTNIYIFFRHLTTLYERLLEVKNINDEVNKEIKSRKVTTFAKDLGLISTQLTELGLDFNSSDAYQELLSLSKRLIEGDIEHQWFEESLRQAYNNKAFKLYTIDKVVQAFVKHTHTLISDSKTSEIMLLFQNDRARPTTSTKDQILYRIQCRSFMSNTENMFRIEFHKRTRHTSIQYIALDDLTLKPPNAPEEKWNYYVTSYSLSNPTEGVPHESLKVPFLERVIDYSQEYNNDNESFPSYSPAGISKSNLHININKQNFELELEPGSSDVFSRETVQTYPSVFNKENKYEKTIGTTKDILDGSHGWKRFVEKEKAMLLQDQFQYLKQNGSLVGFTAKLKPESIPPLNTGNSKTATAQQTIMGSATERKTEPLINGSPIVE